MDNISIESTLAREREAVDDGPMETLAVMIYELGAVSQNLIRAKNESSDPRNKNALHANSLLEIADLVTQAGVLYLKILEAAPDMKLRPTWDELVQIGRQRHGDQMKAIATGSERAPSLTER